MEYAQLLNDASEIGLGLGEWYSKQLAKQQQGKTVTLNLPVVRPNVTVPVIELFLK